MATLQKIRNKAGLLVVFVGLALFAFIIGDFMQSGSTFFHQSKEKVAVVDGTSISIQEFQSKEAEMAEVYKRRSGNASLSEDAQTQVRETVYNNLVSQIILGKETEKIGMAVGKDELSDMIIGDNISQVILQMPDFQNPQTGRFDKTALLQFLQTIENDDLSGYSPDVQEQILSAKKYWLFWEQMIKQQKLESKYSTLLSNAIGVNSIEAQAAYEENKVKVDFDYVMQDYNSVADSLVKVSDSEIERLYSQRKELYKQEAGKVIDFISVPISASQEDQDAIQKTLSDLLPEFAEATGSDIADLVNYNSDVDSKYVDAYYSLAAIRELYPFMLTYIETANLNDVEGPVIDNASNSYHLYKLVAKTVAPDSIRVNQLMLPNFNDEARLKVFADSLIAIVDGGKSFNDMASEASSGQTDGNMGWVTEAGLVAGSDTNFKDEVFAAPLNKVITLKSTYGTHLVQVVEKTKPVQKYKIADIRIAITPSTETYNKLYNDLSLYISNNSTLETFKTAATESGYALQSDVSLSQNQPMLGAIRSSRQAIRWAFEHKRGDISDIFECQDYFVVVAVEGSLKKGYRSLKSVSDLLKRELLNDKKAEKIIEDLKSKAFVNLDQYIESMSAIPQSVKFVSFATPSISGIGAEPAINAIAPDVKTGQMVGPLKGKNGVYVLSISERNEDSAPYNEANQKQTLQSGNTYRTYNFMNVLIDKSDVQDNRIRFY
ncbi:MAG: SurA N-terminal domain-containing protein [Dysgonamonadaceae bacterium]|jgi:peptidyl-prolyl cis-trans isomerase D|nr:SurA N-terminal domain-containing protein [Dysgonamonadaceae bacterium]